MSVAAAETMPDPRTVLERRALAVLLDRAGLEDEKFILECVDVESFSGPRHRLYELVYSARQRGTSLDAEDLLGGEPEGMRSLLIAELAHVIDEANHNRPDPVAVAQQLGQIIPAPNRFELVREGCYKLTAPGAASVFEVDYLRRDGNQLKGELLVRCELPGVNARGGILSVGDFNLSSPRSRKEQGRYLAERARTEPNEIEWTGLLEEFCQAVLAAERAGSPPVFLADLPQPAPDESLNVDGLPLLARDCACIFADGGTAKSLLALHILGTLARRGKRVALVDWEMTGAEHRDRLGRLFGSEMPEILYVRCARHLCHEAERLRRIIAQNRIDFAVFDSVAFACDGPPEAAEVAGRYFQALRQLGEIGSLHLAHIAKSSDAADRKPFGSVFWHNGFRATWNLKISEGSPGDSAITVGLYNRKANLQGLSPAVGFEIDFSGGRTAVRWADLADAPDLARGLSLAERVAAAARRGPLSYGELARELDAKENSIRAAVRRAGGRFTVLDGGRVALREGRP